MAKIYLTGIQENPGVKLAYFHCPGCKSLHGPNVGLANPNFPVVWEFNGDLEKPTFSPSLHVAPNDPQWQCHSFVKDGKIQFLSDCYHELAGQTVDLPEWN